LSKDVATILHFASAEENNLSLLGIVLGRPLASSEERAEQIGPVKGIPVFGLDALGSAAYGPEAALTMLIPLGLAGLRYIVPLSVGIILLLVIVYLSYRQTIAAYPSGGGSYIVARQNLGTFSGLLAASALLIDYALDAAVGISTGIGALTSAVPGLHAHTLMLCLVALFILTVVNLRGVSETGAVFLFPLIASSCAWRLRSLSALRKCWQAVATPCLLLSHPLHTRWPHSAFGC
jgi:hypothetical protein